MGPFVKLFHVKVSFLLDCMGWVLQLSQGSLIMPSKGFTDGTHPFGKLGPETNCVERYRMGPFVKFFHVAPSFSALAPLGALSNRASI